jgi:hypothetical protein
MASPLLPFANARVLTVVEGGISTVNGRIVASDSTQYVVLCFMKRTQYTGVSSGGKKVPLESQLGGEMMPGASGDSFYYRGYALQYAVVTNQDWQTAPLSAFSWQTLSTQPDWMKPGLQVEFKLGNDALMTGRIERSSGVFGGVGIDETIYAEIGGVQLQIIGGEVLN